VAERDELQAWLKSQGVSSGIQYPVPAHPQKALSHHGQCPGELSVTERIVAEILSLPTFAKLTNEEIEYVVDSIRAFYNATT
jgi:dTDP-4-amino-4,6-dideoxygalactose transaminase